jgi:hypothetical protein
LYEQLHVQATKKAKIVAFFLSDAVNSEKEAEAHLQEPQFLVDATAEPKMLPGR